MFVSVWFVVGLFRMEAYFVQGTIQPFNGTLVGVRVCGMGITYLQIQIVAMKEYQRHDVRNEMLESFG